MEDVAISIEKVSVSYGTNEAVKQVSMDIPIKKVTAFIGPSGCGKTTLLRTLNRMNDEIEGCKVEGRLMMSDTDLLSTEVDPVALRKKVGMVFQKPNPFPTSIFENVAFGPKIHGMDSDKLDDLVERCLKDAALWEEVHDLSLIHI